MEIKLLVYENQKFYMSINNQKFVKYFETITVLRKK